jgi:hypothetical protein
MRESNATQFEKCAGRLHALEFPVLIRPAVPYESPATAELIAWAIEVYVFCFLAMSSTNQVTVAITTSTSALTSTRDGGPKVRARRDARPCQTRMIRFDKSYAR